MMKEINQALESFRSRTLKALIIDAKGKAFSAGVDVSEHTEEKVEEMIQEFHNIFTNLHSIEAPSVALVNGAALGGGCEIAIFCDIVIASDKSKFGQPEIKVGVFPPVAAAVFPKLIQGKRALELIMTGETIGANDAEKLGLINHVFPAENFETETEKFIAEKITSNSAVVLQLAKKAFKEGSRKDYADSIKKIEEIYLKELMQTHDANEGLAAFLEKREPNWKNK
jgi:cyclohexa-1,5-dienecarbonyl-CoA hydratase